MTVDMKFGVITMTPARDVFLGHTTQLLPTTQCATRKTVVRLGDVRGGSGVFLSVYEVRDNRKIIN